MTLDFFTFFAQLSINKLWNVLENIVFNGFTLKYVSGHSCWEMLIFWTFRLLGWAKQGLKKKTKLFQIPILIELYIHIYIYVCKNLNGVSSYFRADGPSFSEVNGCSGNDLWHGRTLNTSIPYWKGLCIFCLVRYLAYLFTRECNYKDKRILKN